MLSPSAGRSGRRPWTSTDANIRSYSAPVFGDLDGNGTVEVVDHENILDGATGRTLVNLAPQYFEDSGLCGVAAIADADLDGEAEVYADFRAYATDGRVLWDGYDGPEPDGTRYSYAFVLQADADPEAEIGFTGRGLGIYEADGTPIVEGLDYKGVRT